MESLSTIKEIAYIQKENSSFTGTDDQHSSILFIEKQQRINQLTEINVLHKRIEPAASANEHPVIDTSTCGETKQCVRSPNDCSTSDAECSFFSWKEVMPTMK